jgi:uncharacterized protein (DUF1800 family)
VHADALQPKGMARRAALLSALGLGAAACGGGGGGSSGGDTLTVAAASPPVSPVSPPVSPASPPVSPPVSPPPATPPPPAGPPPALSPGTASTDAARFLIQATFGPTAAEINALAASSPAAWIEAQFNTAPIEKHFAYVTRANGAYQSFAGSFWRQAVTGPDQLRQRMVFALSEIFVVSNVNAIIAGGEVEYASAAYQDMLATNCFGNFRTLLESVTRNVFMGLYLSHMRNQKEDPATGRIPDENYAREVMQLFTIGLWQLNPDGSRKKDSAGADIPTYGQIEVGGMAKVFTGLSWGQTGAKAEQNFNYGPEHYDVPMEIFPQYVSTSAKQIVGGVTIPANTPGDESIRIALDTLFNHANTGPFIGEQLIKRFVTSNPSRAYVGRVAAAFADNGSGVRGDMKAVIRAVLLDAEARDASKVVVDDWGKLREPMIRFTAWMRGFGAKSSSGAYTVYMLEDPVDGLAQGPLAAPSVFNWFRPSYAPQGVIAQRGEVAPEFQITHDTTVTGYARFMITVVSEGYASGGDAIRPNYTTELSLASDSNALLDRLNLLLIAGRMTDATRATIKGAVDAIPTTGDGPTKRVQTAIALSMLSPEFLVQK